ncbi:hypothetical protein MSAN_01834300 [Mycena sanguinolenta]|uniref:Uncharacterized protein n=1 Tax=Mycena sanguinolenta TaxID=230812 RepID=A0A8H6XRW5_9AGAR|nr:hypothetical protein MSAN_01834300 [Mycena sanguinolenta]
MSSRRTAPENSHQSMLDSSTLTHTDNHQSSSSHVPSQTVPPPARRAGWSAPATADTGHGADHPTNHPSWTQDASSAPPTVSNTRKRHRGSRRNDLSSQSAVSDTVNLSEEGNERTETRRDVDTESANPAREADDNPTSRNQSTASTGFKDGKNPADAATGRATLAITLKATAAPTRVWISPKFPWPAGEAVMDAEEARMVPTLEQDLTLGALGQTTLAMTLKATGTLPTRV